MRTSFAEKSLEKNGELPPTMMGGDGISRLLAELGQMLRI
jgi:hypothetical protein